MAIRSIRELKKIMRFNANKSQRGSIDPPDVFNTMEDTLDTLHGKIEELEDNTGIEALTEEEIDALLNSVDNPTEIEDDLEPLTEEELYKLTKLSKKIKVY